MSHHNTTTLNMVGFALIAAGAVMTAVGTAVRDAQASALIPAFGAAVVAAGLVSVVRAQDIGSTRSVVMGAVMIAAGVVAAVIGVASGDERAAIAVPAVTAAMFISGILAVIDGAFARASRIDI